MFRSLLVPFSVLLLSLNMVSKNLTPTVTHYTKTSGPLLQCKFEQQLGLPPYRTQCTVWSHLQKFHHFEYFLSMYHKCECNIQCNHTQYYIMDTPLSKFKPTVIEYTSTISYILNWKCPKHSLLGEKQGDIAQHYHYTKLVPKPVATGVCTASFYYAATNGLTNIRRQITNIFPLRSNLPTI